MNDEISRWDLWNQLSAPQYPHEKAIQFILRRFPPGSRTGLRVFEPGCGNGRNLEFLAREGFLPIGRDVSGVAVTNARTRLLPYLSDPDVAIAGLAEPAVPMESCDAAICIGVLDAAGPGQIGPALDAVVATLRPGASAMFLFASDRDFRILGTNPLGLYGFAEGEVAAALQSLGPRVDQVCMDRYITTFENRSSEQNEHLITFRKAIT